MQAITHVKTPASCHTVENEYGSNNETYLHLLKASSRPFRCTELPSVKGCAQLRHGAQCNSVEAIAPCIGWQAGSAMSEASGRAVHTPPAGGTSLLLE